MKIAILGSKGRMGQMNIATTLADAGLELVAEVDVGDSIADAVEKADAIIDFSSPKATLAASDLIAKAGKIHVIGTTGLSDSDKAKIAENAKTSKVVQEFNTSVGVNVLLALVEKLSATLASEEYDIEILEMHHNQKVDSPSGTALLLGEAAAKGRKIKLADNSDVDRNHKRNIGDIGFATLRGGSVVGDHTVIFASGGDRIEITHKASDRTIFSSGALRAAKWLKNQPNGLYTMRQVLGL
jgi:4-hydroxy-tetrahydrodipicolinate reductase